MRLRATLLALVTVALVAGACDYVVLPPDEGAPVSATNEGWSAIATEVAPGATGDLRVSLTIRNDTGLWSAMQAVTDHPAVLTSGDGKTTSCATVVVGSGGHRLAPGFQMRGFVTGPTDAPKTETIRVECAGAAAAPGSRLGIDYAYATGDYNYYERTANQVSAKLEVDLDKVATDLTYPVGEPVGGLVIPSDTPLTAINDVVLTLAGNERTATTLRFDWHTANSGAYPSEVHIGTPPVIGSDGIVYGVYESPDIATVPVTPEGGTADWSTEVAVPSDVTGLIVLLSVESKKQRTFVNYALDLGAK